MVWICALLVSVSLCVHSKMQVCFASRARKGWAKKKAPLARRLSKRLACGGGETGDPHW